MKITKKQTGDHLEILGDTDVEVGDVYQGLYRRLLPEALCRLVVHVKRPKKMKRQRFIPLSLPSRRRSLDSVSFFLFRKPGRSSLSSAVFEEEAGALGVVRMGVLQRH